VKLGVECLHYNRLCYGCQARRRAAKIALYKARGGACFSDGFSPGDESIPPEHSICESLLLYGFSIEDLTAVGG
jgi:hypothetical protein